MLVTTSQTDADAFASTVAQAQRIGTVTDTETMMLDGEAVSTAAVLNAYRTDESGEISR